MINFINFLTKFIHNINIYLLMIKKDAQSITIAFKNDNLLYIHFIILLFKNSNK